MKKYSIEDLQKTRINDIIKSEKEIEIDGVSGERFLCDGLSFGTVVLNGVAGNATGAYLDGATVIVNGNGQDAVGDTMNDGKIVIHGSVGDACGYAMRGGEIYVKGKAGYRAGIHVKEYKDKKPVIVIGETAGDFLGEYQAGGIIIVLNLGKERSVGDFCGTGMYGGKIFLRTKNPPEDLPAQVVCKKADEEDLSEIKNYVVEFCRLFGENYDEIMKGDFFMLTPNSANPYRQLYVMN